MNAQRLEELLIAWEEDSLTPEELAELKHLLATEPQARRRLVEAGVFRGVAESEVRAWKESESARPMPSTGVNRKSPGLAWLSWRPLAAAACLALAALAGWFHFSRSAPVLVEIVEADAGAAFTAGQRVALREVKLSHGHLRLRLESGVLLDCAAPIEARFESPMRLRLVRGRLSADAGERGKGFTVVTSAGEVVDLGTRFGVEATDAGQTDVVVFEGTVKVRANKSAGGKARPWTTLKSGDAIQMLQPRRKMQRLARIQFSQKAGDWSRAAPAGEDVVGDVRDNVMEAQFHRYFGIVPRGMGEGAQPFSDNPMQRWRALPGESFPSWLAGADLVRTFSADRHDMALEITLTVRRPSAVYVLFDLRKKTPRWLSQGFMDTGARLQVGPWFGAGIGDGITPDADGLRFATCAIWKREVRTPGELRLGPPHRVGDGGPTAMYGLAVSALPPP
jgi:hypothetical protein